MNTNLDLGSLHTFLMHLHSKPDIWCPRGMYGCSILYLYRFKFIANTKVLSTSPIAKLHDRDVLGTSGPLPWQWICFSVLQRSSNVGQSPVNRGWRHLATVGQQTSSCSDTGVGMFLLHDVNLVRTFIPPQASNQRSSGNRTFFQAAVPVNKQKLSRYCL